MSSYKAWNVRFDVVGLTEATMANPNGDPDTLRRPRQDPKSGEAMATGPCIRRKLRDYVASQQEDCK